MPIACCSAIFPASRCTHDFLPQPGDRFWTPADWAWAGGLLNVLLPALHYGVPVVARRFEKFDPEQAFALMARAQHAQCFHPADCVAHAARGTKSARAPRDLHAHRSAPAARRSARRPRSGASRRSASTINEFYGQTECNLVLSSCGAAWRVESRRHRQAGPRPHGRGHRQRGKSAARRARSARSRSSGPIR